MVSKISISLYGTKISPSNFSPKVLGIIELFVCVLCVCVCRVCVCVVCRVCVCVCVRERECEREREREADWERQFTPSRGPECTCLFEELKYIYPFAFLCWKWSLAADCGVGSGHHRDSFVFLGRRNQK